MKEFLINFFNLLTNILLVLIFIRVIISWLPGKATGFRKFITDTTEPILSPIRKVLPPIGGTLDLSPIVAYLVIYLLQTLVNSL
jgi:YggT family protein